MSVKIENLANRPVLLRLNSGLSLHLSPRMTSGKIPDVEVLNNSKVGKLKDRQVIVLHEMKKKVQMFAAPKPEKGKKKSPKGKK